jgi:hypothetical protein
MNEVTTVMTETYLEVLINRVELLILIMIFNTVIFLYYVIRRQK